MKRIICILLSVLIILTVSLSVGSAYAAIVPVAYDGYGTETYEPTPTEEPYYEPYQDGVFHFRELEDGTLELVEYDDCSYEYEGRIELVIPASYNNKPVTSIAELSLNGCSGSDICSVTIPESITHIEEGAFSGFSGLRTIYFNAVDCKEMGSVSTYRNRVTVSPVFEGCSSVNTVIIGENVKTIPDFAFWGVGNIDTISIPAQIERIGGDVFGNISVGTLEYNAVNCTSFGFVWYDDELSWSWNEEGKEYYREIYQKLPFERLYAQKVIVSENVQNLPQDIFRDIETVYLDIEAPLSYIDGFSNCVNLTEVHLPQTITEIGYNAFYWCQNLTDINLPSSITKVGDTAFFGCQKLADINLPSSITTVGEDAFGDTAWLANQPAGCVYINHILYAYKDSEELTDVVIREGTTEITCNAFNQADHIKTLTLPGSLQKIDSSVFQFCSALQSVTFEEGITEIGSYAFYQCNSLKTINLPDSLTAIGFESFAYCDKLESCKFPEGLQAIGDSAFSCCNSLTEITLPDSLVELGGAAFCECRSLKKATLGSGLTEISGRVFCDCSSLESVQIPDTVTFIGYDAFLNCSTLKTMHIPIRIKELGSSVFSGCSSLQSIDLPDGLQTLGSFAFHNCTSLKSARIGRGITRLEYGVFKNCNQLETVHLPDGITEFNSYRLITWSGDYGGHYEREYTDGAFENCYSLKTVNIPDTVQKIDKCTFMNCTSLSEVTLNANIAEIGESAFYNTAMKNVTIYNPDVVIGDRALGVENSVYGPWPVEGFVVVGYKGSTAEAYAKTHKLKFEDLDSIKLLGDANGDSVVCISDVTCIQRHLAEIPVTTYNNDLADVNKDGVVTIDDASCLQWYLAYLSFPAGIGEPIQ